MSRAVKISEELVSQARIYAKTFHRSTAGQIEYWAKIGRIAEENPDLPYQFIHELLLSLEDYKAGKVEPFVFSTKRK